MRYRDIETVVSAAIRQDGLRALAAQASTAVVGCQKRERERESASFHFPPMQVSKVCRTKTKATDILRFLRTQQPAIKTMLAAR